MLGERTCLPLLATDGSRWFGQEEQVGYGCAQREQRRQGSGRVRQRARDVTKMSPPPRQESSRVVPVVQQVGEARTGQLSWEDVWALQKRLHQGVHACRHLMHVVPTDQQVLGLIQ